MTGFVLDASATMRWCFDRGSHPYPDAVLQRLGAPSERAFVPILWRYEVSAVLALAQKNGIVQAAVTQAFLAALDALPITVDPASGGRVLSDVHQLAVAHGLTSYDAAYLELARRLGLPIATLDTDLAKACQTAGVALL